MIAMLQQGLSKNLKRRGKRKGKKQELNEKGKE